ncbi:hypothetical protein BS50DRAFT_632854 [Corynespora cassiicola Philippines]|uniref:Uncharacterized protein n=1 Tax=Corynespora cassiicola Philippines TaxID=1448308 RepID=A0A2T2NUG6_CORCC|nr:hypothetical protein BS50DRAFT_632854 [Corynespora cassiicola Philippines]
MERAFHVPQPGVVAASSTPVPSLPLSPPPPLCLNYTSTSPTIAPHKQLPKLYALGLCPYRDDRLSASEKPATPSAHLHRGSAGPSSPSLPSQAVLDLSKLSTRE